LARFFGAPPTDFNVQTDDAGKKGPGTRGPWLGIMEQEFFLKGSGSREQGSGSRASGTESGVPSAAICAENIKQNSHDTPQLHTSS